MMKIIVKYYLENQPEIFVLLIDKVQHLERVQCTDRCIHDRQMLLNWPGSAQRDRKDLMVRNGFPKFHINRSRVGWSFVERRIALNLG